MDLDIERMFLVLRLVHEHVCGRDCRVATALLVVRTLTATRHLFALFAFCCVVVTHFTFAFGAPFIRICLFTKQYTHAFCLHLLLLAHIYTHTLFAFGSGSYGIGVISCSSYLCLLASCIPAH